VTPLETPRLQTIVSGGQTCVDRAALEAGLPCGGWCPTGRRAEDGVIPSKYPVAELPGRGYLPRTRRNVLDSDATLIVTFGEPSGGTARTVEFCRKLQKPFLVIDGETQAVDEGVTRVNEFLVRFHVRSLNVAGPRGGREPRAYPYAYNLIRKLLAIIR